MLDLETQRQIFHGAHKSKRGTDIKVMLHLPISQVEALDTEHGLTQFQLRSFGYEQAPLPWEYWQYRDGPTVEEMI